MKSMVYRLVDWKLFCVACRKGGEGFCPEATRRQLNRFYARYRLAANFEAVHAHGYSEKALRGYTAGLRLLAAYSAAELLGEAIGSHVTSWNIPDPALAAALRKVLLRPSTDANGLFEQAGLRKKIQLFMDGDVDVRIPATALRVMVAHGSFTPTGTDSLTKAGAEALQRLSDVLLQECERRFGAWLHEKRAKHSEVA
ncbi:hypothetical protein [Tepidimonas ignava]|uniref:hypothetical protein n=1 Tax=Tepidimonas ignava TaxID=114249 RepID=UPI002FD923C9